jgi:glycosyltransferase involved in cell wall biosynthesis
MTAVSVIIPVYKVRNFIERCACSLFEQTLKEIEYIFVDDASPDDSIEILKKCAEKYPERKHQLVILRHERNQGVSSARNLGLKAAKGKYIAYCDSDDYVNRNMFAKMYETAESSNADLVYCDFYFNRGGTLERHSAPPLLDKVGLLKSYIAFGWTVMWNIIARKEMYEKYDLLWPKTLAYCEDFHISVRLMYHAKKIAKVNLPLYYYNQENQDSVMHRLNSTHAKHELIAYTEIVDFFKECGEFNSYERELAWRVLKNKQDMALNPCEHETFINLLPWSHKYILSCPETFCNRKIKIMMWLLSNHCRFILLPILRLRNILKK